MQTPLLDSELFELTGIDAIAFAQSQFMNDVHTLQVGDWQWSGLLNAKGRLIAFFALFRADEHKLIAWLPTGGGEALRTHLQRFVFRSKVRLSILTDWNVVAEIGAVDPDVIDHQLEFPPCPDGTPRRLILTPTSVELPIADSTLVTRWRRADIELGVPYITAGSSNSEQFVPQWLSLDRLSAFSLKKGCYPGQEIVARMHYLGQSKREARMVSGEGDAPRAMSSTQAAPHQPAGEIVWSHEEDGRWWALAVCHIDAPN